ncbi:unnamed protein product [marine sediment metagenome]|uniref:Uncharacterized protein n=1 Tax=marine sediment metagenome TaxID=412755 RepID=X0UD02_9ZZZZ
MENKKLKIICKIHNVEVTIDEYDEPRCNECGIENIAPVKFVE